MNKQNELLTLFTTFFKIGAFTFGGGYAMIPLIKEEVVNNHHWMDNDEILEMIAIAESTPGPIAINSATYVGYRVKGFWGSLCATLGVVLPSFIIIYCLSYVIDYVKDLKIIKYAFQGIRVGVLVLILNAIISLYKDSKNKDYFFHIILIGSFILVRFFKLHTIITLIIAGILGFIYSNWLRRDAK